MILSQILQDDKVFIDTNIFLYAVFEHAAYGKSCRDFLKRVEKNEIMGYTSDLALNELFHKLMIAEISEMEGIDAINAIRLIKRSPELIGELKHVWEEIELVSEFGVKPLNTATYPEFVRLSKEYLLSAADAAHIATMLKNNITIMASNDRDFKRVQWLKLRRPEMSY